jgi:hypothetical protein
MNQCDGCCAGLPIRHSSITDSILHYDPDYYDLPVMVCQAARYDEDRKAAVSNISWAMQLRHARLACSDYLDGNSKFEKPNFYHIQYNWMEVFFWE